MKIDEPLNAENVLAPAWISPGMRANPKFDTRCDACMMGFVHRKHDKRAFNTSKALGGDDWIESSLEDTAPL